MAAKHGRIAKANKAQPSAAHLAIAELESDGHYNSELLSISGETSPCMNN
ncbi:hypothetical protein DBT73_RS23755 [Vibrio parahaemolyticus]|nr:hypothetical protein [Vibrio vulnificus]EJC6937298.1 hypothetical protein [Vibrio parahaemolyticus]ANH65449.1 hypothetical protein FORC16_3566 [Vibrio vulnificus]EJC7128187.1 hypothetical protein [Vibrio parahaemolyticus]EJG0222500.1 hypothetical protein [Vibrio parahaemolyticus]EJG0232020.1 hypothetical protein [Vibrio parahaemolyticus]